MQIPKISPHLFDYKINPKAFINAHNFPHLDCLVEEVKRIDSDESAYTAMLNEPLFLDDFNPKDFYQKRILAFFDNIFSKGTKYFMRGEGLILYGYRTNMNLALHKFPQFSNDAINIAKFYDRIYKATKAFRKKLRFWKH